ncbi:MAG: carotenoid 1,2-hydratase [Deltaproteobacteria bacterium]|nr:carotenoid 1,2-hydratase [Candidatus Anaeroferrophillus wilburensis]MBN2889905.1 carotenoid 1,2-hydratase [Deltaproteobacteria bacterium]
MTTIGKKTIGWLFFLLLAQSFSAFHPALAWQQAVAPRPFQFPRDHGSHPDFKTEWWYVTGHLETETGRQFGYQFTIFRQGLRLEKTTDKDNVWKIRDLFILHSGLSDVENQRFFSHQDISRAGPGLAGAAITTMNTWLKGSRITMKPDGKGMELTVKTPEYGISLQLQPSYAPILNGTNGLSHKGSGPGQASYYYSWPRLESRGTITLHDQQMTVSGLSWLDREFATNQLGANQAGWDWLAIHFNDGRSLMLYRMRNKDGSQDPASSGTMIAADGTATHLTSSDFTATPMDDWQSPHTHNNYPLFWKLNIVRPEKMLLQLSPLQLDQEIRATDTTLANYWEGAIKISGTSAVNEPLLGYGYLELVGYGQPLTTLK